MRFGSESEEELSSISSSDKSNTKYLATWHLV